MAVDAVAVIIATAWGFHGKQLHSAIPRTSQVSVWYYRPLCFNNSINNQRTRSVFSLDIDSTARLNHLLYGSRRNETCLVQYRSRCNGEASRIRFSQTSAIGIKLLKEGVIVDTKKPKTDPADTRSVADSDGQLFIM